MNSDKPDFSKTVNLPKTDFPMKAGLPQKEPVLLKKWQESQIYKKLRTKNAGKKKFILHDGPPYANGHIHLGTALNKILKDIIVKYKTMSGFDSPYTPGWDCHGLPIEQTLMKEMKADKHNVDRLQFRKKAAEFARKFIDIQRNEFERLGVFADWEKPYLTLQPKYEGVIVRVFGDLVKAGYVYRQKKPVYWCPTCETALADAEVEYADHVSHSVYVKFKVTELTEKLKGKIDDRASVLIWTTTPWTLPANVALAFQPEAEYAYTELSYEDGRKEYLIFAKRLVPVVTEKIGAKSYKVIADIAPAELEGIKCKNPLLDRESVGVLAEYVTLDDGTGVVHIAPGHGQEDYQVGLKYKLPIISPVNDWGKFTSEVPEFEGQKVFAANPLIAEKLKSQGNLLFEEKFTHSYPHCWRCKKPIIFRATEQWFLSVEYKDLRKRMQEKIKDVQWIPEYGFNRMNGMLESRPDWCLSRQRLWGVPVPIVYCRQCKKPVLDESFINRVSELFSEKGSDSWYELSTEEIMSGLDIKCSCGSSDFKKEEDILDVWFDSGVSHEAVLASGNFDSLSWPADMYLEGSDQHRGWFQTSLIPAVALRNRAPYNTVLTHGFVVDGAGKKMSKSIGNVILPEEIIKQFGADILRLWVSTSDYREDIKISKEILSGLTDTYRKIRNTLRFLLGNISDFDLSKDSMNFQDMREIDKYALVKLQELVTTVNKAYDTYEFHKSAISINSFCTVFLSGFYLDALKDTLYCDKKDWAARRSSQTALYEICSVLIRSLAPILSFTSEEAWQELRKTVPSLDETVFAGGYPSANGGYNLPEDIVAKWDRLFKIKEKALAKFEELRKDKKIGSNLEARVSVVESDKAFMSDEYKQLLCLVLGSWDVELSLDDKRAEPEVTAEPSKFKKCQRCWRYTEDVSGSNPHNTDLCPRCVKALEH